MKYKYLAISGNEMEVETEESREEIIKSFEEDNVCVSVTPLVEIDGQKYWNKNTQYGNFTKSQWVNRICPKLRKIYD